MLAYKLENVPVEHPVHLDWRRKTKFSMGSLRGRFLCDPSERNDRYTTLCSFYRLFWFEIVMTQVRRITLALFAIMPIAFTSLPVKRRISLIPR